MTQNKQPHLLIVDDDDRLRDLLSSYLSEKGFSISRARNAAEARELIKYFVFDLVIMDVMMPGESGLSLTEYIKSHLKTPPAILLLTARGEVDNRIEGFEKGADDYLSKPFEPRELYYRLQSLLKRSQSLGTEGRLHFGGFSFDPLKRELYKGNDLIALTSSEAALLKIFSDHVGEYLSREKLIEAIGITATERTIDVQITRLRKKIEENPKRPRYLQTIRHKGYILWDH